MPHWVGQATDLARGLAKAPTTNRHEWGLGVFCRPKSGQANADRAIAGS